MLVKAKDLKQGDIIMVSGNKFEVWKLQFLTSGRVKVIPSSNAHGVFVFDGEHQLEVVERWNVHAQS